MGEKTVLLFLHGDAATEHLRFVRTAGAVLPFLRLKERAPSGVRPTSRKQFVVFVRKRILVIQFRMREFRASEHGLPMQSDVFAVLTLRTIEHDVKILLFDWLFFICLFV